MYWQVGEARITRIVELETPGFQFILPGVEKHDLTPFEWLEPYIAPDGQLVGNIQALVIEADDRRILVDTCIGNDKPRPLPAWSMMSTPFLDDLTDAGFPPDSIDTIVCTHLHLDHVGWNTRLVDDKWVPTFPKARYLIARDEWEHWNASTDENDRTLMADSVRPVFDAGLVDLVETDAQVAPSVQLYPTHGHTPGHVSIRIADGDGAVITGDILHHPCQFAFPGLHDAFDVDPEQGDTTRRTCFEEYASEPVLVIGTHIGGQTAGRVSVEGDAYRFD